MVIFLRSNEKARLQATICGNADGLSLWNHSVSIILIFALTYMAFRKTRSRSSNVAFHAGCSENTVCSTRSFSGFGQRAERNNQTRSVSGNRCKHPCLPVWGLPCGAERFLRSERLPGRPHTGSSVWIRTTPLASRPPRLLYDRAANYGSIIVWKYLKLHIQFSRFVGSGFRSLSGPVRFRDIIVSYFRREVYGLVVQVTHPLSPYIVYNSLKSKKIPPEKQNLRFEVHSVK